MLTSITSSEKRHKSVLIITCSCGGGILQAANAKMQEVKRHNPDARVIKKDLIRDWIGKGLGKFTVHLWDSSQKRGNVKALIFFIQLQKYTEWIIWLRVFLVVFFCLMKEGIDRVIDTQPLVTSAIVKAIRLYNFFQKKELCVEKVIVDLPTKWASHYFRTIKKLSSLDQKHIRVVTIEPLLEETETAAEFWKKHCGLTEEEIQYEDHFIREGFHPYRNRPRLREDFSIQIRYKNEEELSLMKAAYQKGKIAAKLGKNGIQFTIGKDDLLFTVLLGSQPAAKSTLNYVKKIVEILERVHAKGKKYHLFVFCADHQPGEKTLFRMVHDTVLANENHPAHLTVVPLSFQEEDVIASLFFRSDMTFTRSGGQTSMELMSVMRGEIMIHSEAKTTKNPKQKLSKEELLQGIPGWEAGNACYLLEKREAKLVTPDCFEEYFIPFLQKTPYLHAKMEENWVESCRAKNS